MHPGIAIIQRREHYDRNIPDGLIGFDPARDLVSVHSGHHYVEQDKVGRLPGYDGKSYLATGRAQQRKPFRLEHHLQQVSVVALIIHDQDRCGLVLGTRREFHTGRTNVTTSNGDLISCAAIVTRKSL